MNNSKTTKIIEFSGIPRSGKSTSAEGLKRFLESKKKRTHLVKERASLCPIPNKLHPDFNLWTSLSFFRELLVASNNNKEFIIADRGLFDANIWINLFCEQDKIYKKELSIFQSIYDSVFMKNIEYYLFFFKCDIQCALNRKYERTLVKKTGRIMNEDILGKYILSYSSIKSQSKIEIIELDTTKMPIANMLNSVYRHFAQS